MLKINKFISLVAILIVVGIAMAVPAAVQPEAKDRRGSDDSRVEAPVKLAILIQDDLVSHVSNELDITRDFIKSLPTGSEVMVGYIRSGSLQVRQPFTYDLARAAKSLRMVVSSTSASPYNPYVEVLEALRRFDSKGKNPNVILLISDGLDASRGFDAASVLRSLDMERAIAEAKRRDVSIYSFYAPAVGLTSVNSLAASWGQSSLNRISDETGGKAFFQGTTDFVTFDPYFRRLTRELNRLESAE